jgi:hypothetical protein
MRRMLVAEGKIDGEQNAYGQQHPNCCRFPWT